MNTRYGNYKNSYGQISGKEHKFFVFATMSRADQNEGWVSLIGHLILEKRSPPYTCHHIMGRWVGSIACSKHFAPVRYRSPCRSHVARHCIPKLSQVTCRSTVARGVRRGFTTRLLGLQVRIPQGAWMFVSCECCVLSGRSLWDGTIPRPEESYRRGCV